MNCRTVVSAALIAVCLGASGAAAQGIGLSYPVAYGQYGPVYWPSSAYYGSTITSSYASGFAPNPAPYEPAPAPAYAPPTYPAPAYPAPAYPQPAYPQPAYPAPAYPAPTPVYQPVVTTWSMPWCTARSVVTTYTPVYPAYSPRTVTSYSVPVYQTAATVPAGPRVFIRPKVYVEGQPLRNLLRAITP